MIDTHSHIDFLTNPQDAIKKSLENGVEYIIVPSSSPENFMSAVNLANGNECIYSALGVHPEYEEMIEKIRECL